MEMRDFVVRFGAEGGGGIVTAAELLAQAATQVGYHALTFSTFPSQIMGGPVWTQSRISVEPVLSAGDQVDVLVAFNREAYENHREEVRDTGFVIYDSGEFQLSDDSKSMGLPLDDLARSTGNVRAANMVVIGALAHLFGMPQRYLDDFVSKRFSRGRSGDQEIIDANIKAMSLGREHLREMGSSLGELAAPSPPEGVQLMLKGNEAMSLGSLAAGLDF